MGKIRIKTLGDEKQNKKKPVAAKKTKSTEATAEAQLVEKTTKVKADKKDKLKGCEKRT